MRLWAYVFAVIHYMAVLGMGMAIGADDLVLALCWAVASIVNGLAASRWFARAQGQQ